MKAIITNEYGGAEVLKLQEVEKPVITDNEILVQVHACSVNPIDWKTCIESRLILIYRGKE